MRKLQFLSMAGVLAAIPALMVGCGEDDDAPPVSSKAGTGGTGAAGGTGGTSGTGGASGAGGGGGTSGTSGTGGTGGTGGDGGQPETCPAAPTAVEQLGGEITASRTLMADKLYEVAANGTFVVAPATLTIAPCTTIIGGAGSGLIVTRGAKIEAVGEANKPIVLTSKQPKGSRAPGDWGGVVILGRADINPLGKEAAIEGISPADDRGKYGPATGTPANTESSGTLKYVRIEFAGFKFGTANELNGLTMGGVGSGTVLDYVMVNQPLDDGFEWFGGTVNGSHLVVNDTAPAPGGGDDMYDCDFGWVGTVTNYFGRKSSVSSGDPNGFECDNNASGSTDAPRTNPTFDKGSMCGRDLTAAPNGSYGAVFRRASQGTVKNTVFSGWKYAFDIRNSPATAWTIMNSVVAAGTSIDNPAATSGFDEPAWFNGGAGNSADGNPGFSADDCFAAYGSAEFKRVMDSNKGAFEGDAKWLEGAWVDFSPN